MDISLNGTPSVRQLDGIEYLDFGVQKVTTDDKPLEAFDAYVTVLRCPRCGIEARSVVDIALAQLGGNEAAFRAAEDTAFSVTFSNVHRRERPDCR